MYLGGNKDEEELFAAIPLSNELRVLILSSSAIGHAITLAGGVVNLSQSCMRVLARCELILY